jgi:Attenuator of Hedgehog
MVDRFDLYFCRLHLHNHDDNFVGQFWVGSPGHPVCKVGSCRDYLRLKTQVCRFFVLRFSGFAAMILFCLAAIIFPLGFYVTEIGGQIFQLPNSHQVGIR